MTKTKSVKFISFLSNDLFLKLFSEYARQGYSVENIIKEINNGENEFFFSTTENVDEDEFEETEFLSYMRGDQSQHLN